MWHLFAKRKTQWLKLLAAGALVAPGFVLAQAAPEPAARATVKVETLLNELDHPWSLAFLPASQGALITQRSGQLLLWRGGQSGPTPVTGVPEVWVNGQAGLWDVRLSPDFAKNHRVYLSFAQRDSQGQSHAQLGYGTLSADAGHLTDFKTIFVQMPPLQSGINLGGRLAFDAAGNILMSLGDNNQRIEAQNLRSLNGKIIRLTPEGGIPADNPFVGRQDARPEIWSYGQRNPQGLAYNPWNGQLWETEHGPRGGDEINIIQAGKNYGWPLATYGIDYSGSPIPEAKGSHLAGAQDPLYYWRVSPAISGMAFYASAHFPQWQNSLFIAALKEKSLIVLKVKDGKVSGEQRLLSDFGQRIREVQVGPDGYLYLLTDERAGKLLKLSPQ
ncbi:MAG: PQQ-dependent sugar dehydrogenase [Rouxiella aceris]|uniref:PQQ-dependent sugar dehydrogenase n=1 Tax=Rouxiella aceris TaxID=2703884 RepID=UPI002848F995|nr:PQQ-dependent sugar dehydrogenase [Rouxiella aceris]MDR3433076.1 PQQ-dependent sugar dehydrogenase [Rouxiella aceris]